MNNLHSALIIAVTALVTMVLRFLPFLIFCCQFVAIGNMIAAYLRSLIIIVMPTALNDSLASFNLRYYVSSLSDLLLPICCHGTTISPANVRSY